MSGSGSTLRAQSLAKRCAKLREQGCTIGEIAELTGISREKVNARIELGQRLLSLKEQQQ